MQVSVHEAEGQLSRLLGLAEAGAEVILTREGHADVRLVPVVAQKKPKRDTVAFREFVRQIQEQARETAIPGPCAARSQDFLYGDDGMPG